MNRKRTALIVVILSLLCLSTISAQEVSPETLAKRARRKNLTVKEWNTEQRNKWLDHLTVYDSEGRKIEEIEYASYGQKERITTEYNQQGLVEKEIVYDDRNRAVRIRKYEYNTDGTKCKQYNYLPNGKLYSVKSFEYIFSSDADTMQ